MTRLFVSKTQSALIIAITCLTVALFAICGAAQSAPLYVATNGNDSNAGTINSPFLTIAHAGHAATPGTDIIVRGGVYTGQVEVGSSGTSTAYIRYYPYGGEKVIIDGTGTPPGTSLVLIGGSFVEFRGFEVRNATSAGIEAKRHDIRVLDNIVHDSLGAGIYSGFDYTGVAYNNVITGNTVFSNSMNNSTRAPGIFWSQGIRAAYSDNTTITGNVVYKNYGEGISSGASAGVTISSNTVFDNYSTNVYLNNSQSSVVTRNFIFFTGDSKFFWHGYPAVGIGLASENTTGQAPSSNDIVTNNIVLGGYYGLYYGNYGGGFGMQNSLFANNTVVNTTFASIRIDADNNSGNQVANNIFYLSSPGTLESGSPAGFSFRNNCWFGGTSGTFAGDGDVFADPLLAQAGSFSATGYNISSASPCRASGRKLIQVNMNFWGTSRTVPYSSGAY